MPPHRAAVGPDEVVGYGRPEDRSQRPLGLRRAHGAGVLDTLACQRRTTSGVMAQLAVEDIGRRRPKQEAVQFEGLLCQRPDSGPALAPLRVANELVTTRASIRVLMS